MEPRPYKIVIDPGHGGIDPGAVNNSVGLRESDINLQFAKMLERVALEGDYLFRTRLTHRGGFKSLKDRCEMANNEMPDALVSLHCNASDNKSAVGYEVWTSPGKTASDGLATGIIESMSTVLLGPARKDYDDGDPDKEANFYILRKTRAPAVLIELDFISNDDRARWLADKRNQERVCKQIAESIELWLEGGMQA